MRPLSDTIARLSRLGATMPQLGPHQDRLSHLGEFGSNPGNLQARIYLPEHLPERAPLVVVLHGCTQTAAAYDHGAGWSVMADRHGFALLFPEQTRANNANLCFNWFEPGDTRRGQGEVLSISQMIDRFCDRQGLDRSRVYINGLSAGGAMTASMLACYPELFAGGAIIGGLPYGSASTVPQAFDRMRGSGSPNDAALETLVRKASSHEGSRPPISVWHGTADITVAPSNVDRIVGQWHGPLGVGGTPSESETIAGHRREVWRRPDGSLALETMLVNGMGHGTPIDTRGADGCGHAGPFILDVGLSSTSWLVRSWALSSPSDAHIQARPPRPAPAGEYPPTHRPARSTQPASSVAAIIEDALRTAGLLR